MKIQIGFIEISPLNNDIDIPSRMRIYSFEPKQAEGKCGEKLKRARSVRVEKGIWDTFLSVQLEKVLPLHEQKAPFPFLPAHNRDWSIV